MRKSAILLVFALIFSLFALTSCEQLGAVKDKVQGIINDITGKTEPDDPTPEPPEDCTHADGDKNHLCDTCQNKLSDCADGDSNHTCDVCGKKLSECKDGDSNHTCDVCGKKISECKDDDNNHNCDVCGTKLSECADTDSNHKCDVCDKRLSFCKDDDLDYKCDICPNEFEDVTYALNVSDTETGTRSSDDIQGKFTIPAGTEVRTRTKTFEGVEYTKSVKLGSSSSSIKVDVPGDGKLTFLIQNGSSSADTQFVVLVAPDGTTTELEFVGKIQGSPVVKLEMNVTEGEWTIKRKSGTIDIFHLQLECHLPKSEECGFELASAGNVDFISGTTLDLAGIRLNAIFDSGKTSPLDNSLVTVDTSKVDMTKAGEYDVTVSYKDYAPVTFRVYVYEPKEIKLGFDATVQGTSNSAGNSVYFNHSFKEVYSIGEALDTDGLSVIVVAKCGEKALEFKVDDYEITGFDSSSIGNNVITVTANGVSTTTMVYITDAIPTVDEDENAVLALVDPGYFGIRGDLTGPYHVFSTIQQALDFLAKADPNVQKELYLCPGYYNEKLEITIPNLHIRGEGATADEVVIEWNSLYGIPDASGYSQVTDSTATVAIRDTAINCTIENVTISNYWNSLEVFDRELGKNYPEHRALALLVQADHFIMRDSRLIGYQDTVEFFTGRQYLNNVYISGTTDFIFGTNNTTLFENCQIHSIDNGKTDGGYITAFKGLNKGETDAIKYGAIFYRCKFTADENVVANKNTAIGRTWGAAAAVALIECEIDAHVSLKGASGASKNERYVSMNGILPTADTVQFVEYGNTGAGALTEAVAGMTMLTAQEAANYVNIAVIFGKTNGKVTYVEAWNPHSTEVAVDDKTYYYFEQKESTTGTSYTIDTSTNLAVGESATLGDMLISAEGGKIAWNANSGALNMKAGAFISFTVKAGTEIIISAYPGYQHYTVNGVATSAADFTRYYGEDTEVVILSTGDCYLFSVIINPGETAPEAADLEEIKVEGFKTHYAVGEELVYDGVKVNAYYTDHSIVTVTDYTVDATAVNTAAEGTYDVIFSYGGAAVTVTVTYEDPGAGPEISKDTYLDFSTTDGLVEVQNNPKVTMTGSVRHNGGEIQITGTISFMVKAGTVVTVYPYANSSYVSYTLGMEGEENLPTYNETMSVMFNEDCTVVYTGLSNNYLVGRSINCPLAEGKYVFGGSSEEGDVTGILESIPGMSISGTFRNHSDGAQLGSDSQIIFIASPLSTVTIQGYDTNYGKLLVLVDGVQVEMNANAQYVFTATYAATVIIEAVNAGTDEEPAYNKSYITYIDVKLPVYIEENTTISFGNAGNYKDSIVDFSGITITDNGADNAQVKNGSFSFAVRKGAIVTVHGYPGYTSYNLGDGDLTYKDITDEYFTYEVTYSDCLITISHTTGNNYFYSITVEYPVIYDENTTVDLTATGANIQGATGKYEGLDVDATNGKFADNNGGWVQVNAGTIIKLRVAEGAEVTVSAYTSQDNFTVEITNGICTITCNGNDYLNAITVKY